MKKLVTLFAVGALAAGSVFADKGEKKEGGDKPKAERAEGGEKGKGKGKGKGEKGKGGGKMLEQLDTDKSGDISFDEFKAGPRSKDKPEDQAKKHFDRIDKDGDGKITQAEITAFMKEMKERREKGKGKGDGKGKGKGKGEGGDKKGE